MVEFIVKSLWVNLMLHENWSKFTFIPIMKLPHLTTILPLLKSTDLFHRIRSRQLFVYQKKSEKTMKLYQELVKNASPLVGEKFVKMLAQLLIRYKKLKCPFKRNARITKFKFAADSKLVEKTLVKVKLVILFHNIKVFQLEADWTMI